MLLSWTHYRTLLQLFASKYKLYLPTEEELRAEIENKKTIFNLQHGKENNEDKK